MRNKDAQNAQNIVSKSLKLGRVVEGWGQKICRGLRLGLRLGLEIGIEIGVKIGDWRLGIGDWRLGFRAKDWRLGHLRIKK